MTSRVAGFVAEHGMWAGPIVGLLSFGESLALLGLFIPATTVMLAVGGLVGAGVLDPAPIVFWAVLGAILGDWLSYGMGRWIGPSIYHRWPLKKHRPMVARTRLFFRRFGFTAVFLGRFLGPIRATVPLVAGVVGMAKRPFQIANIVSAIIWVPMMFAPGILAARMMGPQWRISEAHLLVFGGAVLVMTSLAMAVTSRVLGSKQRNRRRASKRNQSNQQPDAGFSNSANDQ
ncbi:DedA family protein [Novosphingobium sp. P6W]|uniref:DedA family protein n=1 Tax=Novosphingobium sp. P6W TaxID=1609758 RepID=UPI0005C4B27A|nr:DedA family protein [Novosphingobium sp. P6W]AXB80156.1 DedA family protein [Novosphingobium sp. P6W]